MRGYMHLNDIIGMGIKYILNVFHEFIFRHTDRSVIETWKCGMGTPEVTFKVLKQQLHGVPALLLKE